MFEGEEGIDSGGLTKDWFRIVKGTIQSAVCLLKKHDGRIYHIDPRSGINERAPKILSLFW